MGEMAMSAKMWNLSFIFYLSRLEHRGVVLPGPLCPAKGEELTIVSVGPSFINFAHSK